MTATNHTATGMLLLALVPHPLMLPVAIAAHFALDAFPHYGSPSHTTRQFLKILLIDMLLAAGLLLAVFVNRPEHWPFIMLGGIACAGPDIMWLPPFLAELAGRKPKAKGPIRHFHSRIQWGERPWGIYIELAWLVCILAVLHTAHIV